MMRTEPPKLWARIVVGTLMFSVLLGIAAAVGIAVHFAVWTQKPIMTEGRQVVIIPRGTSWVGVVEHLHDVGIVDRPRYLDVWGRLKELPPHVKAGSYTLEGPMTVEELAAKLREGGSVAEVTVTFPEGLNIWAIAQRLEAAGLAEPRAFVHVARDPEALQRAGIEGESFEGYLFPDTYRFVAGMRADELLARMHDRWKAVWGQLGAPESAHGLSKAQLVTLASIVEKETAAPEERPLIARVFYNRLELGMRLQTDPTCVYDEERWSSPPTPADCKDPLNRYSTYVIDGLPPGPIANPGRAALQAVLTPDADEANAKKLYFVAVGDGSGKHTFSETLEEHNRAVQVLRENRRASTGE